MEDLRTNEKKPLNQQKASNPKKAELIQPNENLKKRLTSHLSQKSSILQIPNDEDESWSQFGEEPIYFSHKNFEYLQTQESILTTNNQRLKKEHQTLQTSILEKKHQISSLDRQIQEKKNLLQRLESNITQLNNSQKKVILQNNSQKISQAKGIKDKSECPQAKSIKDKSESPQKQKVQELYDKKIREFQRLTGERIKQISHNFNKINQRISKQRDQVFKQNQSLKEYKLFSNGYLKQIYLSLQRYCKIKQLGAKLDDQLIANAKSTEYQLGEKDIIKILSSFYHFIHNTQYKQRQRQIQIIQFERTVSQYIEIFANSNSIQDLNANIKQKLSKDIKKPTSLINLDQAIIKFAQKSENQIIQPNIIEKIQKQHQEKIRKIHSQRETDLKNMRIQISNGQAKFLKEIEHRQTNFKKEIEYRQRNFDKYRKDFQERYNKYRMDSESQTQKLKIKISELTEENQIIKMKFAQNSNNHFKEWKQKQMAFIKQSQNLKDQIKQLNDQIEQLKDKISYLQQNNKNLNKEIDFNKKTIHISKKQNEQKDNQITILREQINNLKKKNDTYKNEIKLLKPIEIQLKRAQQELSHSQKQTRQIQRENGVLQLELSERNSLHQIIRTLETTILSLNKQTESLKSSHYRNMTEVHAQITQFFNLNKDQTTQIHFYKNILQDISFTLQEKCSIPSQIDPKQLNQVLKNFNPVTNLVGCRLITSVIIHGHDTQRSDILKNIEGFTQKKVKRTDVLGRYPDKKSLIADFPENDAFIMLYKTCEGRVIGSFSEGLKKKTFLFGFLTEKYNKEGKLDPKSTAVKCFNPSQPKSSLVSSIDLFHRKFLRYGNDEVKINLMSLGKMMVDPQPVVNNCYGKLNWEELSGAKNQLEILLEEVEIHRVQFQ